MMLSLGGWRMYHEAVCSPGLPWDCEKKCVLWRMWDSQNRRDEGKPQATYASLERRG